MQPFHIWKRLAAALTKRAFVSVAVLILSCGSVCAQQLREDSGFFQFVEGLSCEPNCGNYVQAKAIKRDLPEFSRRIAGSFNPHAEALMIITLTVTETGSVRDVEPIYVLGPQAFADATVEAIKSWTYEPATREGKAVPQVMNITFVYDATSLVPGVPEIADQIKELADPNRALSDGDVAKLREFFRNPLINQYQRAMIALPLAKQALKQGDYFEARRTAILGNIQPSNVAPTIAKSLWMMRINADLFLGEIADALASMRHLAEIKTMFEAGSVAQISGLLKYTKGKIDAMPQFSVQAKIPEAPESKVYWHFLYRRIFGFHLVSGSLDKFVLGCRGGAMEFKISETSQWQIPKSWSNCRINVYGAPGTRFHLIEARDDLGRP